MNDRKKAAAYLESLVDEKGKKARIAIAGAFGEMLNRVFDQLEETRKELAGWLTSHNWSGSGPRGRIVVSEENGEIIWWGKLDEGSLTEQPSGNDDPVKITDEGVVWEPGVYQGPVAGSYDPDDPGTKLEKE